MEFENSGIIHYVERVPHESKVRFLERGGLISELYSRCTMDYEKLIQYSKIWASIKYDGTRYSSSIEKCIQDLTRDSGYSLTL